jgi:hypothetical protein
MPALAVDMTPEEIQKMVDEAVNRKLQEHERRESAGERAMEQKAGQPGAQYPTATGPMTDIKVERKGEENVPLGFGSTGSGKLIYAKPFLAAPRRQSVDTPTSNTWRPQVRRWITQAEIHSPRNGWCRLFMPTSRIV